MKTARFVMVALLAFAFISSGDAAMAQAPKKGKVTKTTTTVVTKAAAPAKTAEEAAPVKTSEAPAPALAPGTVDVDGDILTKEEVMAEIKDILDTYDGIAGYVPGLRWMKDETGKPYYVFKPYDGQPARIEDLSLESLGSLLSMLRQATVRHQSDRVSRQLQIIADIQRMHANAGRLSGMPPATPKEPPQPPKAPAEPPQIPQPPRVPER